uniref:Coiled-coil and C2 domain-containing protein 1B n=1 Tax=Sinocyclocheilus grahami TaxID=75366 RepID=A0A672QFZ9_SINGR
MILKIFCEHLNKFDSNFYVQAPLPMEDIAKMAEACMKDIDDDEDDSLENDEDLLIFILFFSQDTKVSSVPGSIERTLEERINLYRMAITNAKAAGETSKARRYERGLKTLQTMLASVRKGGKIDETEIPPPVACGASGGPNRPPAPAASPDQHGECDSAVEISPVSAEAAPVVMGPASNTKDESSGKYDILRSFFCKWYIVVSSAPKADSPAGQSNKDVLLERQKEYRMAALKAKQAGDIDQAKVHIKTSKGFDAAIEALEKGQPVDMSSLPPPLSQDSISGPTQPQTVLDALEQRMAKYKEAFTQAKASGDERKARMHDRIAKQYQAAIRAHKAGRPVNFDELPAPPGFPPIPGQKAASPEQGLAAVLETANKLTSNEAEAGDGEEDDEEGEEKLHKKHTKLSQTALNLVIVSSAQQQLEFLEGRKKQYMKAALQAKQKNDLEQAKTLLRAAKGLDPMIEAARSGKRVDISKVPSPPGDEDEDFILVHHSDVQISEKAEEVYTQLTKLLKEQYEKCVTYSKQFTHMGNVAETTKFENMAEQCKKSLEVLKLAQNRGLQPPKHHFEERTYRTVRIFPELSSTDMVVVIVRGMNLPAPPGVATNDLDAYVKFEFPYPSTDQPQKHKTSVIKNTNNPEYNQTFKLNINRNHRGFRRVIQSKGLKLEVLHKAGFLRSDKPVGTAQLKLEKLETESEVREIVELMDGRKATGGRLEVRVRLREPLGGQDHQTVTERWLVLEEPQVSATVAVSNEGTAECSCLFLVC